MASGGGITGLQFILFYSIFLFTLMQISAMAGQNIIIGIDPPTPPKTVGDALFGNFGYFFRMMGASSAFALFGTVVLTPFVVGLIWLIIETIRGR